MINKRVNVMSFQLIMGLAINTICLNELKIIDKSLQREPPVIHCTKNQFTFV